MFTTLLVVTSINHKFPTENGFNLPPAIFSHYCAHDPSCYSQFMNSQYQMTPGDE